MTILKHPSSVAVTDIFNMLFIIIPPSVNVAVVNMFDCICLSCLSVRLSLLLYCSNFWKPYWYTGSELQNLHIKSIYRDHYRWVKVKVTGAQCIAGGLLLIVYLFVTDTLQIVR